MCISRLATFILSSVSELLGQMLHSLKLCVAQLTNFLNEFTKRRSPTPVQAEFFKHAGRWWSPGPNSPIRWSSHLEVAISIFQTSTLPKSLEDSRTTNDSMSRCVCNWSAAWLQKYHASMHTGQKHVCSTFGSSMETCPNCQPISSWDPFTVHSFVRQAQR